MPHDAKAVAGERLRIGKEKLAIHGTELNVILFRDIDGKFATTTNGAIVKKSNGEILPDDEPLFLIRARDLKALPILRVYREMCLEEAGLDWQVEKLTEVIQKFVEFKHEHPDRMKQPGITRGQ